MRRIGLAILILSVMGMSVAGCSSVEWLIDPSEDAGRHVFPGLPDEWLDVVDAFTELDIPDLSALPDLPQLDALPLIETASNGILFRGPVQRTIESGKPVPGTDITLLRTDDGIAIFEIGGLRSERRIGDSLDFDGRWDDVDDAAYSARLRIYRVGDDHVRIAGVQQLGIADIEPERSQPEDLADGEPDAILKFPFVANVRPDEAIPGTTFRFIGAGERGAELSGLEAYEYPYFKIGDSITWRGLLRTGIPIEHNLRVIHYDDGALRVGGVVAIQLAEQN